MGSCLLSVPCLQLCLSSLLKISSLGTCYIFTAFIYMHLLQKAAMDSDPLDVSSLSSKYPYLECGSVIDLGLSLRTIQHETYNTSGRMIGLSGYREVTEWTPSSYGSYLSKNRETGNGNCGREYCSNEGDRRKWGYVKVTMDGFVVGRKVCVLDHGSYSTLAHQLEDMFGIQSGSGLRLFQMESEFSLVYRDEEGIWRNAGDVPWKEFVESVERLRIARRNDALLPF